MALNVFCYQGIVGTAAGTLWYINWSERTSIRLVSGHQNKVSIVLFFNKPDLLFKIFLFLF